MNLLKNFIFCICIIGSPEELKDNLLANDPDNTLEEEIIVFSDWEMIKNKNNIKIFEQNVTLNDSSEARRLRGNFQLNLPVSKVVTYIKDGSNLKNWMTGATESYSLDDSGSKWFMYAKLNIPWPFEDQDFIVENTLNYNYGKDTVFITFQSRPNKLPMQEDAMRIEYFYGHWKLVSLSPEITQVEYVAFSKAEPLVPRFIQYPIVKNTFWSLLNKFSAQCQVLK